MQGVHFSRQGINYFKIEVMAIDHFGYAYIISKYAVVVAMIAYFIGKYIGQVELRKKNKTKTH